MHIILRRMTFFPIYHYIGLFITITLFRLHVNNGKIFMHKRKFHKRNSSLSQNLKTKHTNSLQTLQFEAIEKKYFTSATE